MKNMCSTGLPGGARDCLTGDVYHGHSQSFDMDDGKDGVELTADMTLFTNVLPPITNTFMSLPLTDEINKTHIEQKIVSNMKQSPPSGLITPPPSQSLQPEQQPHSTISLVSSSSMHQDVNDYEMNFSPNMFDELDLQYLNDLSGPLKSNLPDMLSAVNPLQNTMTTFQTSSLSNSSPIMTNGSQMISSMSSLIHASPMQSLDTTPVLPRSYVSPIHAVQVSEPNFAAATSDHAYSAKPHERFNHDDVDMSRAYHPAYQSSSGRRKTVPNSKSNDSILVNLLSGGDTKVTLRNINRNSSREYSSSQSEIDMSPITTTNRNSYPMMSTNTSSLLDLPISPHSLSDVSPFSSDAAVRSDILESLGNDLLFECMSAPPLVSNGNGNCSMYSNRAKSDPNSPSLSPASQLLSAAWSNKNCNRSLSTPVSRCGSNSPDHNRVPHSSMLERFLTTNTPINPNKGSDDAFPDDNFNEKISKLNITDSHHRASADCNLLKQLLTGEIDGQRVQHMEQHLIDRRIQDDKSACPQTLVNPQAPLTPEQTQIDMLLETLPDPSTSMNYENDDSTSNWLSHMDIPEIQVVTHTYLEVYISLKNNHSTILRGEYSLI